jgi:hypothetical protein
MPRPNLLPFSVHGYSLCDVEASVGPHVDFYVVRPDALLRAHRHGDE